MENSLPRSRSGNSIPLPHWTHCLLPFLSTPQEFNHVNVLLLAREMWKGRDYFLGFMSTGQIGNAPSHVVMNSRTIIVTSAGEGRRTYVRTQQTLQHNSFLQSVICANASQKSFISDYSLWREMQGNSLEENCLGLQSFRVHQPGNEARLHFSWAPTEGGREVGLMFGAGDVRFSFDLKFSQWFVAALPLPHSLPCLSIFFM